MAIANPMPLQDLKMNIKIGGLDHSLNVMAYESNRSQKNLNKIQNPVHSKVCIRLIKLHQKDIKNNL